MGSHGGQVELASSHKAVDELAPGTRFGRYEVIHLLRSGGMGAIYEARHLELDKRVALKILHRSFAEDESARQRFLREGQVACRIRHPHVVEIYDVGVEHGLPYLVMEYLDGEDLASVLKREGPLEVARAVGIMLPVLAAVASAHEEGILHRDLKPENIFLAVTKHMLTPKLLDFGISKSLDSEETRRLTPGGTLLGTPMYMAPEQAVSSGEADSRSDQYALGVILYECLTGVGPFEGDTLYQLFQAIVDGDFAAPTIRRPGIPALIESVILRAMATEPEFRFPDLPSMARPLLDFASPRDRAIWAPAFSPTREYGEPLTPSERPPPEQREDDHESTRSHVQSRAPRLDVPLAAESAEIPLQLPVKRAPRWLLALPLLLGSAAVLVWWLDREPSGAVASYSAPAAPSPAPGGVAHEAQGEPEAQAEPARSEEPAEYTLEVVVIPSSAEILLDGAHVGRGSVHKRLLADGTDHTLLVRAEGYMPRRFSFVDSPPPERIALRAVPRKEARTDRQAAARPARQRPRSEVKPTRVERTTGEPSGAEAPEPEPPTPSEPAFGANQAPILE